MLGGDSRGSAASAWTRPDGATGSPAAASAGSAPTASKTHTTHPKRLPMARIYRRAGLGATPWLMAYGARRAAS